jgi:uncharacterized protein (DUF433 family)
MPDVIGHLCSPGYRVGARSVCQFHAESFEDHIVKGVDINRITLEPGKRGGRSCIRDLRITVYDVLSMLSSGMSQQEIQDDFPELTPEDILAALAYAAEREHQVYSDKAQ